jgi:hypothetical protein
VEAPSCLVLEEVGGRLAQQDLLEAHLRCSGSPWCFAVVAEEIIETVLWSSSPLRTVTIRCGGFFCTSAAEERVRWGCTFGTGLRLRRREIILW